VPGAGWHRGRALGCGHGLGGAGHDRTRRSGGARGSPR
jgi:hypothetical protein